MLPNTQLGKILASWTRQAFLARPLKNRSGFENPQLRAGVQGTNERRRRGCGSRWSPPAQIVEVDQDADVAASQWKVQPQRARGLRSAIRGAGDAGKSVVPWETSDHDAETVAARRSVARKALISGLSGIGVLKSR
jgi:hypothetical protein